MVAYIPMQWPDSHKPMNLFCWEPHQNTRQASPNQTTELVLRALGGQVQQDIDISLAKFTNTPWVTPHRTNISCVHHDDHQKSPVERVRAARNRWREDRAARVITPLIIHIAIVSE